MRRRVIVLSAVLLTALVALAVPAPAEAGPTVPPPTPEVVAPTVTCGQGPASAGISARAARAGHPVKAPAPRVSASCATLEQTPPITRNLGVTYGWYIYLHFTPKDVDAVLWNHDIGISFTVIMAIVCGAIALEDAPAGVACGILETFYLAWLPGIFQTAHARNNGGVVIECLLPPADLPVGYYWSGNGR